MWKPKVSELLAQKIGAENRLIRPIDVARDAGIREATVYEWMSGKPLPKINAHIVQAFCDYFGVNTWDVVELVRDEPSSSPKNKAHSTPIRVPLAG